MGICSPIIGTAENYRLKQTNKCSIIGGRTTIGGKTNANDEAKDNYVTRYDRGRKKVITYLLLGK